MVDECGPDGYVKGSRNQKNFHVGGRGMLQVQGVLQNMTVARRLACRLRFFK